MDFFEIVSEVAERDVAAFLARHPHAFLFENGGVPPDEEQVGDRGLLEVVRRDGQDGEVVLGRSPLADLQLDHPLVSGRHVALERTSPATFSLRVRDLGSTNGTTVDGVRLKPGTPGRLKPGSILGLGPDLSFTLHDPPSLHSALAAIARKVLDAVTSSCFETHLDGEEKLDGGGRVLSAPRPPKPAAEPPPRTTDSLADVELYAVCQPLSPARLPRDVELTIGRTGKVDLVLPHPSVSRRHASLTRRNDLVLVRDLGSANGVRVGDRLVQGETLVEPGAAPISIGVYEVAILAAKTEVVASCEGTHHLKADGLRGTLETMPLSELLQSVELHKRAGAIKVDHSGVAGEIVFRDGLPERASFGALEGEEAVIALLGLARGEFTYVPAPSGVSGERPTRRFDASFTHLLLEASRRADESRRR